MQESDNYYVYMYSHPVTLIPFYVGKGHGDRAYSHIKLEHEKRKNPHKRNILEKLSNEQNEPIIEFIGDGLTEKEAFDLEKYTIARFGRESGCPRGPLVNCTDGGEGSSGFKMTMESRAKMSKSRTGIVPSEETRVRLSIANKGKVVSLEARKKQSETMSGRKQPDSFREMMVERGKVLFATTDLKEKMRIGREAFMKTEAYRQVCEKVAASHRGMKRSPESRARMSEAGKKRNFSQEIIDSMLAKRRITLALKKASLATLTGVENAVGDSL